MNISGPAAVAKPEMLFYAPGDLTVTNGVTLLKATAAEWYRKAADQGDSDAQYKLGVFYENGYGVTQDKEQAMQWYKKAAEQGNESAKNAIDGMQGSGLGSAVAAGAALGGAALLWKILRG